MQCRGQPQTDVSKILVQANLLCVLLVSCPFLCCHKDREGRWAREMPSPFPLSAVTREEGMYSIACR